MGINGSYLLTLACVAGIVISSIPFGGCSGSSKSSEPPRYQHELTLRQIESSSLENCGELGGDRYKRGLCEERNRKRMHQQQ